MLINLVAPWCSGYQYCTTSFNQPELRFCASSKPACGVSEIRNGENLWQWFRLDIRLNAFRWSTIPHHQSLLVTGTDTKPVKWIFLKPWKTASIATHLKNTWHITTKKRLDYSSSQVSNVFTLKPDSRLGWPNNF